jgi:flagellar basal-body rod modification protein FlgD
MTIQSATSSTSSTQSSDALGTATSQSNALGKDAFMKLLVAQISHQDPLKPMDDTAFVSQLAQFSALEQALGTNSRLDTLSQQEAGVANSQTAALVGKSVTVRGSNVTTDGSGLAQPIGFTLNGAASQVTVTITDSSGKTVRTMQTGAHAAGLVNTAWDGRDGNGLLQTPGTYTVSVSAKDSSGTTVGVTQQTTGTLKAVSFDSGYTKLILDNGVEAPASDLLRVNQ